MGFEELKARQRAIWGSAPWERVAETLADLHDDLVARLRPQWGERWLDLATGTGAVAIRASRAGAQVTALDLAPALIETAKRLAAEQGLPIRFEHRWHHPPAISSRPLGWMRGQRLAEDDVEEFREATEADRMAGAKDTSGARTQNWFGSSGSRWRHRLVE